MKDRIFHWAKLHELGDWLACGWVFAQANAPMHHHDYSFMMEFLCNCKMRRPVSEEWRGIEGYEGIYEVSSFGQVRVLDRLVSKPGATRGYPRAMKGRVLKFQNVNGYRHIALSKDGKTKRFYVSHIVASAFLGPRPHGMQVCHNDGVRWNNRVSNLRYDTRQANEADKVKHGSVVKGEDSHLAHLTEAEVRQIRRLATSQDYSLIASRFGVSVGAVASIIHRRVWAHLPDEEGECGTLDGDLQRRAAIKERRGQWATELNKSRAGRVGK